jgi:hypothetical protein
MVLFEHFKSIVIDEISEYLESIDVEEAISLNAWQVYHDEILHIILTRDELIDNVSADFVEKIIAKYSELPSGKKHILRTVIFDACYHFCNLYVSDVYE